MSEIFTEKYIKTKEGLEIFTESIGDAKNPVIILLMGAMNQGIFWYDSFCRDLSDNNFFIIRYDYRDTGNSSLINYIINPYDLDDLAKDTIEILDGYNITKAHVVGLSMGGFIGQLLAVKYKERVETLTLLSTTADQRPYMDAMISNFKNKYDLPYPDKRFLKYIENNKKHPPISDNDFRDSQIEGWKIFFGHELSREDLDGVVRLIDLSIKRNKNKLAQFNHGLAVAKSKDRLELVKNINIPTLIIHGDNDPCFSVVHAQYLNDNIYNSKLEIIKDMGHMFSLTEAKTISRIILKEICG
jgi:pimeloyl-ACP methyl ester carboxylesterase